MAVKILVVGGSGFVGGHVALRLAALGHDVTIGSRRPPPPATGMAALPFLQGDYVAGEFTIERLSNFDGMIFAAANDARQRGPDEDEATHLNRANVVGIPRIFAAAREAGIVRAVHVGSFYPQVVPHMIERSTYVRSRWAADEAVCQLATAKFGVCSVNPPYIIGKIDGLDMPWLEGHARYALGQMTDLPYFAPSGGVNFMSLEAMSDALIGALLNGEPGKHYLVGDQNLTYAQYFGFYRSAAGLSGAPPVNDAEHPLLPDWSLYAGRGGTAFFEPDEAERALLGYRNGDLGTAFAQITRVLKDDQSLSAMI